MNVLYAQALLLVLLMLVNSLEIVAMEGKGTCPIIISQSASSEDADEFRKQAFRFVESVKAKDRATFVSFLRRDTELMAVLPTKDGGHIITDYDAYLESQDHWFHGKTGSFNYSPVKIYVDKEFGSLIVNAQYRNSDGDGPFLKYLIINFSFRKIDGKWIKVFSQNTLVKEARGSEAE